MNAPNPTVTPLNAAPEAARPARSTPLPSADGPEAELLARLRSGEDVDDLDKDWLTARLVVESDPTRLWELLTCVEHLPPRSIDLEAVFNALGRLVEAEAPLLRVAAYRWLAGLHRINMRYEMRAKLVMRDGLDRETGLAHERLRQLLRRC